MIANTNISTVWTYNGAPDNDVHDFVNNYPTYGDSFIDFSNFYVYRCMEPTSNSQIWSRVLDENETQVLIQSFIDSIPQSDWSQSDSSVSDFIKNKPTFIFSTPTFSSATSSTQLSSSRNTQVLYTFPTSMTSLLVNQNITATLQYADDSDFTTNVVTVNSDIQGCSGILSLILTGRLQVQGVIPAGKYRKVILSQTGGATVPTTLSSGQEVLL